MRQVDGSVWGDVIHRTYIDMSGGRPMMVEHIQQDVQPLLDFCERNRNSEDKSQRRKSDLWHVAEIPVNAIYAANRKYGVDVMKKQNRQLLKRLLNGEWKGFLTKEVRI